MNSIDMLKAYDKQKWQELWQNSRELLQKIEKENMGFIRLLLVTVKKICLE